jgi:hypothetical protein
MLAVGDEGFRAVEHVAVAGGQRGRAYALKVGAGARLAHGNGADQFAGRVLRQPTFFLLLGAVMQNVRRDDARMQRRAESVEAAERKLAVDHGFMGKGAAGTAIFLRHRSAEQSRRAGLGPHLARIEMVFVPFLQMRAIFGSDETARGLFQEHDVLAHPCGPR